MLFRTPIITAARLAYLFASGYWLLTGIVTVITIYLYWLHGPAALQLLIYFKLITSAVLMVSNYRRKFPGDVFYLNFGLSLSFLVAAACAVDLLVWIIGTILIR